MDHNDTPKLGDFAVAFRLKSLTLRNSSTESASPPPSGQKQPLSLGNFSKLYHQLGVTKPLLNFPLPQSCEDNEVSVPSESDSSLAPKHPQTSQVISEAIPFVISPPAVSFLGIPTPDINSIPSLAFDSGIDSETGHSDNDLSVDSLRPLGAVTPPSTLEVEVVGLEDYPIAQTPKLKKLKSKKYHSHHQDASNIIRYDTIGRPKPVQHVLSYQLSKYGPIIEIHDHVTTFEEKHSNLMRKLVSTHACDSLLQRQKPEMVSNGIHVFIDMSNIMIGFQNALRAKYKLAESVRLVPLPRLNLSFLHKLLVRDRHHEMLNVGCSMHPSRDEPLFVQEYQDIGYRVDIRHRRPEQATEDIVRTESAHTRYVEDMVDETLQIRIGESVMQYFDKPGTLVLATGDARPAKYSDGFLAYARRALKMGWNIEVVSWKASRSAAWKRLMLENSPDLVGGMRFVELDHYLDELWMH